MRVSLLALVALCLVVIVPACSTSPTPGPGPTDSGPPPADGGPRDAGPGADVPPAVDAGPSGSDAGLDAPAAVDASVPTDAPVARSYDIPAEGSFRFACDLPVPAGTEAPLPLPTYAGTCPTLVNTVTGGVPGRNTIMSSGDSRGFILVAPSAPVAGERLPIVFLWHHMGSEADTFLQMDYLAAATDEFRFIAVLPESLDDLGVSLPGVGMFGWEWPWRVADSAAREGEELQFFDDMLACVAEEYEINEQCVSTGGVSAGGLWQPVLAAGRSRHLASVMSLSGGVDEASSFGAFLGFDAGPWAGAEHRMPFLVVWGGPTDVCAGLNFQNASRDLAASVSADGHALVECTHNCGHAAPPFDPTRPFFQLVDFVMNHPYWLADGDSPYEWYGTGLPDSYESWCGMGAGSATIRTGMCSGAMPCPL